MVFITVFYNLFIEHTYATKLNIDCNIGYRDSYDVVRIIGAINVLFHYFSNKVYGVYQDIIIYKNIFYSFTNTNCKVRFSFSFFINIISITYILCYSLYRRIVYVKEYKQKRSG